MTSLAHFVLLVVAAILPPGLDRFPDRQTAIDCTNFAIAYRTHLMHLQDAIGNDPSMGPGDREDALCELNAALAESWSLWDVWDDLRLAWTVEPGRRDFWVHSLERKLQARHLGDSAVGLMPPPVPLHRLRRVDAP